ncbi:SDR family NAD(P)-dependent oxidoreductase [Streptomyces olivoreticuli]|uniref:SDR family NAD(P)-dependent oxidoreductase n=1 Tax=Streptomyces olivoreticuli TaxID=68246 RepID=UPI001F085845|nr:SDR family NAD(P)-dependent oxidoreductase [Streptomyces olivoreticuli]
MMSEPHERPLAGRKALVVGGSTGIGRGIAEAWAAAGADVLVLSRSTPAGSGSEALRWAPLDLTDADAARERLSEATAGTLDLVCFSAIHYGDRRALFGEVTESEWRRQVDVNLHGLWLTLQSSLPALRRAAPGLFVGVSSEVVYNAGPGRSGYAATKAAASALLNSVAQEEDADRVRIVQVLPAGMVDTPGIRRRRPADFDYDSYMQPGHFGELARLLAVTGGAEHHGDSLVVDGDGQWRSVREEIPASQSRAVRA